MEERVNRLSAKRLAGVVRGSGFEGLGFRVYGLGFRV